MLLDICLGLMYLKENEIFHCDLKPGNILFDEIGERFLISDFGTSGVQKKLGTITVRGFTPCYTSPELINGMDLNYRTNKDLFACDIYSFGMTMLQAYLGIKNMNKEFDNLNVS